MSDQPELPVRDQIGALFASLDRVEQQREALGAAVDPILDGIRSRLLDLGPTEPTPEQARVAESWRVVSEIATQHGLEATEPIGEVASALEAVESHRAYVARVMGGVGLEAASSERDSKRGEHDAVGDRGSEVTVSGSDDTTPTPERDTQHIIIEYGEEGELRPNEETADTYRAVLDALVEAGDGPVNIAEFLRGWAGMTSSDIRLVAQGRLRVPDGLDVASVRAKVVQFYTILKTLKKNNVVEHTPGKLRSDGEGSDREGRSGTLRAYGPVEVVASDESVRYKLPLKPAEPYKVTANLYQQTVENGLGAKVDRRDTNEVIFARTAKALGLIAVAAESDPHVHIKRATLAELLNQDKSDQEGILAPKDMGGTMGDLRDIVDAFDGEFPLIKRSKGAGSYFEWMSGATVEVVDGFPEKPEFDNPVIVSVQDSAVMITIDGKTHSLIDYDDPRVAPLLETMDSNPTELIRRTQELFRILGKLEKNDVIQHDDILLALLEVNQDKSVQVLSDWVRRTVGRLNDLSEDVPIVNRRAGRASTVRFDINRAIQVIEQDTAAQVATGGNDIPPAIVVSGGKQRGARSAPAPIDQSVGASESGNDVPAERTAGELVVDALGIEHGSNGKIVRGRLLQNQRFEYPATAEEAVYLLGMVASLDVQSYLREQGRFRRADRSMLDGFIHEVMVACYTRLLSRGDFEEITSELTRQASRVGTNAQPQLGGAMRLVRLDQDTTTPNGDGGEPGTDVFADKALAELHSGRLIGLRDPIQALTLLDLFGRNRSSIRQRMSPEEFKDLEARLNEAAAAILGKSNLSEALSARRSQRARVSHGRAVQTSSGEEGALHRTDAYREPPHPKGSRRNRRRQRGSGGK